MRATPSHTSYRQSQPTSPDLANLFETRAGSTGDDSRRRSARNTLRPTIDGGRTHPFLGRAGKGTHLAGPVNATPISTANCEDSGDLNGRTAYRYP